MNTIRNLWLGLFAGGFWSVSSTFGQQQTPVHANGMRPDLVARKQFMADN
jgi:hypothetical protein